MNVLEERYGRVEGAMCPRERNEVAAWEEQYGRLYGDLHGRFFTELMPAKGMVRLSVS